MKPTTSLCFSKDGLLNERDVGHLLRKQIETVIFFTDGTAQAYDHLKAFDFNRLRASASHFALGRLPLYDLRMTNSDGTLSDPHYIGSEDQRIKWVCAMVCAPILGITISDITSQSETQADLDDRAKERILYLAHQFWSSIKIAEARLGFPAAVIDRMTKWTYSLTPQTMDIMVLRQESGLESLTYNPDNDILSVTVAGDIFTVKLKILNEFYGMFILPTFNKIYGRRMRLSVKVGIGDPTDMSYGELGMLVDNFSRQVKTTYICHNNPIESSDLLSFARKAKINEESCLWPTAGQSIEDLIKASQHLLIRGDHPGDGLDQIYPVRDVDLVPTESV